MAVWLAQIMLSPLIVAVLGIMPMGTDRGKAQTSGVQLSTNSSMVPAGPLPHVTFILGVP